MSSVHSSASFEEAGQYGLGRLGFSDLSLKDEQHLSIRAIYEGRSGYWLWEEPVLSNPPFLTNLVIPELRYAGSCSTSEHHAL